MTIEKVSLSLSLSLDAELVARARQVAGRRGLSALVNDALRINLQHERLRTLLTEMDAELGPVPADELDRARAAWPERGVARSKSRRSADQQHPGAAVAAGGDDGPGVEDQALYRSRCWTSSTSRTQTCPRRGPGSPGSRRRP